MPRVFILIGPNVRHMPCTQAAYSDWARSPRATSCPVGGKPRRESLAEPGQERLLRDRTPVTLIYETFTSLQRFSFRAPELLAQPRWFGRWRSPPIPTIAKHTARLVNIA
jgi:hypothetical protein